MNISTINVPLDIIICISIGVVAIIGVILMELHAVKNQTIFNSSGFDYGSVISWSTIIVFFVICYIAAGSSWGWIGEAKNTVKEKTQNAITIEEKEATVIDKAKDVKISNKETITPVVIKGKMIDPIVSENKTIPYLMRLYDGNSTYTIAVDEKTYKWYDVKDTISIVISSKKETISKIEIQ